MLTKANPISKSKRITCTVQLWKDMLQHQPWPWTQYGLDIGPFFHDYVKILALLFT
jgi:hypothetical protein